jgi:hypothetical protein
MSETQRRQVLQVFGAKVGRLEKVRPSFEGAAQRLTPPPTVYFRMMA